MRPRDLASATRGMCPPVCSAEISTAQATSVAVGLDGRAQICADYTLVRGLRKSSLTCLYASPLLVRTETEQGCIMNGLVIGLREQW